MVRGKLLNFRVLPVVLITLLVLAHGRPALSAGYGPMEPVSIDVSNTAALQRGARNFVNYCMGCHSAEFMRFNRLAEGLQLTEVQVMENLAFTAERPHDTMQIAMRMSDAERWFGQPPPDLSLIARVRGTTWLYNFLRSYYPDESRPTGMNNLNLTGTSMPHVLWELQGEQRPVFETRGVGGVEREVFVGFEQVSPGLLTPEEYDAFVRDIVTFLSFVGEPIQLERQRLGVIVIAFLLVFGLFAWLLQQEIWKDVK
ncbi:MAG: cytochrome c1 [Chromatiales bacterium]|nr:cytochrome c1 [Chromatiales bacterium]